MASYTIRSTFCNIRRSLAAWVVLFFEIQIAESTNSDFSSLKPMNCWLCGARGGEFSLNPLIHDLGNVVPSNICKFENSNFLKRRMQLRGGARSDDDSDNDRPTTSSGSAPVLSNVNMSSVLHAHDTDWSKLDKDRVFEGLKNLYLKRVKPLEDASWYSHFSTGSTMVASDFDAKPIVLLLGQYSVGKTSFIRALLGKDFPGMRIGPEPTTDRFVAVSTHCRSPRDTPVTDRGMPS